MTVLPFPVAPFLHEWSPSATIPRPTAKMDKLICLGWMFEKQKGGELGTGFLRRTSYEVLNKAHILEMRRLPRNTSKWKKKFTERQKERWSCWRKREQTEASHRGDGSRGCPWNCLTHYCSSTAMHGDGRLRERELSARHWQSESERQPCF